MPRYIDADKFKTRLIDAKHLFCQNQIEFRALPPNDKARADEIDNCIAMVINFPTADVVEVGKITSVITRLRSNRDSNLTRYTSNEGKEGHIIVSQKDRGYFQALDDVEKLLLGWKEKDNAEIH